MRCRGRFWEEEVYAEMAEGEVKVKKYQNVLLEGNGSRCIYKAAETP